MKVEHGTPNHTVPRGLTDKASRMAFAKPWSVSMSMLPSSSNKSYHAVLKPELRAATVKAPTPQNISTNCIVLGLRQATRMSASATSSPIERTAGGTVSRSAIKAVRFGHLLAGASIAQGRQLHNRTTGYHARDIARRRKIGRLCTSSSRATLGIKIEERLGKMRRWMERGAGGGEGIQGCNCARWE